MLPTCYHAVKFIDHLELPGLDATRIKSTLKKVVLSAKARKSWSVEHKPVLLKAILENLSQWRFTPTNFLDGTFGRGGHCRAIMSRYPGIKVVAMDRDPEALHFGRENFPEVMFLHCNFSEFENHWPEIRKVLGVETLDFVLLDLGVSSPQLDEGGRGFSFYHDGPLDMRMDSTRGVTAADVLNGWAERDLVELFQKLGEVRRPHRVVKAIVKDRKAQRFETTRQLAGLIERVDGWRKKGHHPATSYFLALRMQVNEELSSVEQAIPLFLRALTPGGRIYVITFHSLEDRIVKYALRAARPEGILVNKKVIVPDREEVLENPRARSAKLRIYEKGRYEHV